jgi:hypothetical protein
MTITIHDKFYNLVVECQDIDNGKMCQHIANKVL